MNTAQSSETPRERQNRLAREAYACRKSSFTAEQLDNQCARQREAYRVCTETESNEQANHRRKTRRSTYMHNAQQSHGTNAALIIKAHNEKQYSIPTASEIAVLMVGDGQETEPSNRDIVLYKQNDNVAQRAQNQKSTLTAWFEANCDQNICQIANDLTYSQFSHNAGERYYLCMLLNVVHGLLQDDLEWDQCLKEATEIKSGYQLRQFDDILYKLHHILHNPHHQLTQQEIETYTLHELEDILIQQGKSLKDFPDMPIPTTTYNFANRLLNEEINYNQAILCVFLDQNLPCLNEDQRHAESQSEFANWLLQVGKELIPEVQPDSGFIHLPSDIVIQSNTPQNLIKFVYSNLQAYVQDPTYFTERGILAPLNDDVDMLNTKILAQFSENEKTYYSADALDKNSKIYNAVHESLCSTEFLNSLKF
ncbi:17415_t:CDS:2, partial [Dentiscutata erythropus]